jgi:hypothetical protein
VWKEGATGLRPSNLGKHVDPENCGQRAEVSRGMNEAFGLIREMKLACDVWGPYEAARERCFSSSSASI